MGSYRSNPVAPTDDRVPRRDGSSVRDRAPGTARGRPRMGERSAGRVAQAEGSAGAGPPGRSAFESSAVGASGALVVRFLDVAFVASAAFLAGAFFSAGVFSAGVFFAGAFFSADVRFAVVVFLSVGAFFFAAGLVAAASASVAGFSSGGRSSRW